MLQTKAMKIKELSGLSEYLNQQLWDVRTMIFRGVSDSTYELIPSIGRCKAKDETSLLNFEKTIFEDFKQRAFRYLSHEPKNDFEWLFLAQHYGIKTRLLDWTTSPLIALYFACDGNSDKECAVYKILMSRWYSNFTSDGNPFDILEVGGLEPPHKDVRYINQAGVFTISPRPTEPLNYPSIFKFTFSSQVKEEIRWQLRKMGIHASLIYPGLESIAKDIIDEHETLLKGGIVRTSNMFEM
jgi:hypothetical protein